MKKVLLGTSALLAVAGVAFAGEAPKMAVTGAAGVFFDIQGDAAKKGTEKQAKALNATGHDINQVDYMNEIHFKGAGKSDSGLAYGAKVEFRPLSSATDEANIFFAGDWGRLEIGQDDSAPANWYNAGSNNNGSTGAWDGIDNAVTTTLTKSNISSTSDANKITYLSSNFAGLQFGVSYTPQSGVINNVVESGVQYSGKAGDVSYAVDVSLVRGNADNKTTTRGESRSHVGAQVGFGAVTVSGSIFNLGKGTLAKTSKASNAKGADFGVSYAIAGATVGVAVANSSANLNAVDTGSNKAKATETWYSLGATVPVADGLTAQAELNQVRQAGVTSGVKGTYNQILVGTRISF